MTILAIIGAFGLTLTVSGWIAETDPRDWREWWTYRVERLRWQRRAFRCRAEGDEYGHKIALAIIDNIDMRRRWR